MKSNVKHFSNCIVFAIALYIRRYKKGKVGYIVIRRSRCGPFPHFLYAYRLHSGRIRFVSYSPLFPHTRKCPPFLFTGFIKWDDK